MSPPMPFGITELTSDLFLSDVQADLDKPEVYVFDFLFCLSLTMTSLTFIDMSSC